MSKNCQNCGYYFYFQEENICNFENWGGVIPNIENPCENYKLKGD